MSPAQAKLKLSPYDLAIEAAKAETCAEITERVATGASRTEAMNAILAASGHSTYTALWKARAAEILKAEEEKAKAA